MHFRELIALALREDIGEGDITSLAIIPPHQENLAKIIAKEEVVLCGMDLVREVFHQIDPLIEFIAHHQDGEKIPYYTPVCTLYGKTLSILSGERVALNILGHLSGIATRTREVVSLLDNPKIQILDTRKTMPLWREWQKYAVRTGGGRNHRMGLYDMFLIKDNHISAAGSISRAIERALDYRDRRQGQWKIEVEARNLREVQEAVRYPIDIIMLDNMEKQELMECIAEIRKTSIQIEISGNITERTIGSYRNLDVDFISIGALTHSVKNSDFTLLLT